MFYSHEVLTSHKYGVATVWLMAMHGSKSNIKRINRKQILNVDVGKACQTIVDPAAPMALRLQSNLLYGISRVYLQQCGYVLSDAQTVQNTMLLTLRTMSNAALDIDTSRTRREQLILADDPSFDPDLPLLPPDLSSGAEVAQADKFQTLTPLNQPTHLTTSIGEFRGIILPSSSPGVSGGFRLEGDNGRSSISILPDNLNIDVMEGMEPDFMFNDDGDLIELRTDTALNKTPSVSEPVIVPTDVGASAKVRREHEEGLKIGLQLPFSPMDLDLPSYGDDLQDGIGSPPMTPAWSISQLKSIESSPNIAAPMRRKPRTLHVLPVDTTTELRNRDLLDWNANYLQNMQEAIRYKTKSHILKQAKKNAEHLLWGAGIGGIADQMPVDSNSNPFNIFIGENLFELLTGTNRKGIAASKHDRDSGIDDATQQESRRVRRRTDGPATETNGGIEYEDVSLFRDEDVELPREAVSALNDQETLSVMPWNMSASGHGSSVIPRSTQAIIVSSVDEGKRGSRLISASPLLGRGQSGNPEALQQLDSEEDYAMDEEGLLLPEPSSDAIARTFPPQAQTLVSAEDENFLLFVSDAIAEKRAHIESDSEPMPHTSYLDTASENSWITFEELLPPDETTKTVACQGLMMTLVLYTKGMLNVQQHEHFREINLGILDKAQKIRVVSSGEGKAINEVLDPLEKYSL